MLNKTKYKTFSERPFEVFKKDILQKGFRTSPSSQRSIKSTVGVPLKKQVDSCFNGKEIGSTSYVKYSNNRFLKTGNIQNDFLIDFSSVEYCKKTDNEILQGNEILIAEDGGGDGLGESCLYVKDNKYNDYLCNGVLALRVEEDEKRNYILGFLKSSYFKEFIDNNTPIASTLRHSNGVAKEFIFPLFNNEDKDHKLLSLLVENLIDKEGRIKLKNDLINNGIISELSNIGTSIKEASKSLFMKNDFRCCAKLYNKDFLNLYNNIMNYKYGYFNLANKYIYKRGQNLQISNIGESYYLRKPKPNAYKLVTAQDFTENRTISNLRYLGNKNKLLIIPNQCFVMNATGVNTGRTVFISHNTNLISNINQWVIENRKNNLAHTVFTSCFLSFLKQNNYFDYIKSPSNGGFVVEVHLQNFINIPKFPFHIQESISSNYYNEVPKTLNDLKNYITNEKQRNIDLGIWQLNMECFELKAKINKLVEKIILNKKIHTPFFLT
jgi:hypothetical protein